MPRADVAAIRPARVPSPPPPRRPPGDEAGDEEVVVEFLDAYACARRAATGDPPDYRKARPRQWSSWPDMRRFVAGLAQADLSPVRWIKHSFSMWSHGRLGAPPVRWVASSTLLSKHAGWAAESTADMGGDLVITPSLAELTYREAAMLADLASRPPQDAASLRAAAQRHFPGSSHDELVASAAAEAAAVRARMTAWLERGEWPWV